MQRNDAHAFFETLELGPATWRNSASASRSRSKRSLSLDAVNAPIAAGDKAEAGVQGNQLITFTQGLQPHLKDAVKLSSLVAQRAADNKYDPETQRLKWLALYNLVLKKAGWVGTKSESRAYSGTDLSITMDKLALALIKLAAGNVAAGIIDVTSAAINALKSDNETLERLHTSATKAKSQIFEILPCIAGEHDDVVMFNHAMEFNTRVDSGGIWFWSWELKSIDFKHASAKMELDYKTFSAVEPAIRALVEGDANDFFSNLQI